MMTKTSKTFWSLGQWATNGLMIEKVRLQRFTAARIGPRRDFPTIRGTRSLGIVQRIEAVGKTTVVGWPNYGCAAWELW